MILKIKNLQVKVKNKKVLKGVNLIIKKGEVYALLGPNGSGKTSLVQTILGDPKYDVTSGKIIFKKKVINNLPPEKRVKLGIALAWQHPPAIKGVKLASLLKIIAKRKRLEAKLKIGSKLLPRELNIGYSGGEKKLSELLQVLSLKPRLAIFDEIDSGLDIKNLKKLVKIINQELVRKQTAILVITHSGKILESLTPDTTAVMLDGKIVCQNQDFQKVIKTIERYGYEKCKKCPLLAD